MKSAYESLSLPSHASVSVTPFVDDVARELAACDLVLSRAGASALAELALARRASILVPFPFATHNHQMENALEFARAGASLCIPEKDATPERMADQIAMLFREPRRLQQMGEKAASLARPDAAARIADSLLALASKQEAHL